MKRHIARKGKNIGKFVPCYAINCRYGDISGNRFKEVQKFSGKETPTAEDYNSFLVSKINNDSQPYKLPSQAEVDKRRKWQKRSSAFVMLSSVAVLSAGLTGCSSEGSLVEPDAVRVCQDVKTEKRVEDASCNTQSGSNPAAIWYYYALMNNGNRTNVNIPAVGQPLKGGSTTVPAGATNITEGFTPKGGSSAQAPKVTKGGFGSTGKSGSGATGG